MAEESRQSRSHSAGEILSIKHDTITLHGEWGKCLGTIDRHGAALVWGLSGSGKSNGVMMLAKELTAYGRVLYLSLEEGVSYSFQQTLRRCGMGECGSRFQVLESCSFEELNTRLFKKNSPEFIVIDSLQYMGLSYKNYKFLRAQFPNKLFILVSHAEGKNPKRGPAESILYDAGIKIWINGGMAFTRGRFFGPTGKAVIWPEKAFDFYGKLDNEIVNETEENNED